MSAPRTKRSRAVRLTLILALNLVGISLVLLAGEIYFRARAGYIVTQDENRLQGLGRIGNSEDLIVNTTAGRRLAPDVHVILKHHPMSGLDVAVDTNHLGFRDVDLPAAKEPGEIRVLALGDSITLGDYLPAGQVWVEQAQQELGRRFPDRKIEVVNAGIDDVGIREELEILTESGLSIHPDWVILGFYLNDGRPPWGFPRELGGYGFLRRHSVLAQKIYEELKLRSWVHDQGEKRVYWPNSLIHRPWRTDPSVMDDFIQAAQYDWGSAWNDETWIGIDKQLDLLRSLSREHHFRVLVLCFPVGYQVLADYIRDEPQLRMEKEAAKRGFEYLDLLPLMRTYRDRDDLLFDHCHPQAFGNKIIGRKVADELERLIKTPGGVPSN